MLGAKIIVILSLTILGVSECNTRTVQQKYRRLKCVMIQMSSGEIGDACSKERNEMQKSSVEETLIEAVDSVFSLLGEPCKHSFYVHLRNSYNMRKREIPQRIDDFAEALEAIFGPGAKLIEIEIMKAFFNKVRAFTYSPKQEDISFTNYVKRLFSYNEIS